MTDPREPVIVATVRTPFGRRGGGLREWRPDSLLAFALNALVERAGVAPDAIDDVIAGCVTQAGEQGANVARLGVLLSGFPVKVPGVSLNRMCGSSQQAAHFAAQAIAAGDARLVVACGVESMTRVPMLSDITGGEEFTGFHVLNPGLFERHELVHQGESAERMARRWGLTRADCDAFAKESHRRAWAARERDQGIVATPGVDAEGRAVTIGADEGVRPKVDDARMAALPTIFRPGGDGVVTAGNASQISDGASAVLVASREAAAAAGLKPLARFRARVVVGDDPTLQLAGVIPATRAALGRSGLSLADLDWIEINEAFATVPLAWAAELGVDPARVNPWGGAIAHGHPLGATGAGLVGKAVRGLHATGGRHALVTMCIGHGMATASVLERC